MLREKDVVALHELRQRGLSIREDPYRTEMPAGLRLGVVRDKKLLETNRKYCILVTATPRASSLGCGASGPAFF